MTVSLPVAALSASGGYTNTVLATDVGNANYVGAVILASTTAVRFAPRSSAGAYGATTPFT